MPLHGVKSPEDEDSVVEEEVEDDDDSDEQEEEDEDEPEDELLPQACLPVAGAPIPRSEELPQTADEYLRQVQWERLQCAPIAYAAVEDKPRHPKKRGLIDRGGSLLTDFKVVDVPKEARACPEWEEDAVAAFGRLRSYCQKQRRGIRGPRQKTCKHWQDRLDEERPTTELMAALDCVSLVRLMADAVGAFAAGASGAETQEEAGADGAGDGGTTAMVGPKPRLAEWVFAALLFVEEPLADDTQFQLQQLRRACMKYIAEAYVAGSSAREACAAASLILAVVEIHFRQE